MTVMRIKTLEGKFVENIFHLHLKLKLKISEENDSAVRSLYWASDLLKSLLLLHSSLLLFVLKLAISSKSTLFSSKSGN